MTTFGKTNTQKPREGGSHGFALVISVLLMVLLTLLALGMMSLASISLRASGQSQAAAVARANARLGLMLALGELQSSLGPDQRVSASAAAVTANPQQPHLTGVWESWRWDPATSSSPDYLKKAEKFRRWLVSTATPAAAEDFALPASLPKGESVELGGTLSNQSVSNSLKAAKIPISSAKGPGSLAWAVFDESAKAAIDLGDPGNPPAAGEEVASRNAPPRFRADSLDPQKLATLKTPKNLISVETALIPAGPANKEEFRKRFHDFTTATLGLLTDTANGGLKTDLTSLFEAATFPAASFPADTPYATTAAGAPRWNYLYDHYRKYKSVTVGTTGTPTYVPPTTELTPTSTGMDPSPQRERLLPVIAKMQLVFSLVSHHAHFPDRMNFMNSSGVPKGNDKHAVPHIAYEPIITLLNPYDVALDLKKIRIRVWDPPVGFRFAKISAEKGTGWYRPEMEAGEFHGLARFNYSDEKNPAARKYFTLLLTDGTGAKVGTSLRLQPGEVKVFSTRVEKNWSWAFENANPYDPRSFFDWGVARNFGNVDNRTKNPYGVEAVPGWDARGGLQTDHMSYGSGGRPAATIYDFERLPGGPSAGFVSIRLTDEIKVELKALKTTNNTVSDTFRVDVLAAKDTDATRDVLRAYKFRFADPTAEISETPAKPVISRQYNVGQTLQTWTEQAIGKKKCLAMLEMTARTTKDPLDDSKAWLYNNPVVEGGDQDTAIVGSANQSYDLRLIELTGWTSFPMVEWDATVGSGYGRGYFGASRSSTDGVTNIPMHRVPVAPAASSGDLIASNLVAGSLLPRVVHPFGNSRAHPLLPANGVTVKIGSQTALDHSYFLNDTLWDRYYFSSATKYSGGVITDARERRDVIKGMLDGSKPALNPRLKPAVPPGDASTLAARLDGFSDDERARKLAAYLAINGPFNLNSTSQDAWQAVLASLRDRDVTAWNNRVTKNPNATPFVRTALPLAGANDASTDYNVLGQIRWAGYRSLDDTQIKTLARAIVTEIKNRGIKDKAPPLTLAEFINRRPGSASDLHSQAGILQTAIDNSNVNAENHKKDSRTISAASISTARKTGVLNAAAMDGFTGEGSPPILTQGDLLAALAPIATVRGDTFKIRAYGESRSANNNVEATAWCEAVVQRVPEFIDPKDAPEATESSLSSPNRKFGRRFQIISFRWLNAGEI